MAYGQSDPTAYRQWEMPQEVPEREDIDFSSMDMVSLANGLDEKTIVSLKESEAQDLARRMARVPEAEEILKRRGVHKPLTYMGSGMPSLVERAQRSAGVLGRPLSGEIALSLSNPIVDLLMDLEMVKKGVEQRDPLMASIGAGFILLPIGGKAVYEAVANRLVKDLIEEGGEVTQERLSEMGQRAWQETLSELPADEAVKAAADRARALESGFAELAGTADQEAKDLLAKEAAHNRFVIESRAKNEGFDIPPKLKAQFEEGPGAQAVAKELTRGGPTTVREGQAGLFPEEIVAPPPKRVAADVVTDEGREGVAALQLAREEAASARRAAAEKSVQEWKEFKRNYDDTLMEGVRASGMADAAAEREAKEQAAAEMTDRHSKQRARNIREQALARKAEQEAQAQGSAALERFQSQQRAAGIRDEAAAASRASDTERISEMGAEAAALEEAQGIQSRLGAGVPEPSVAPVARDTLQKSERRPRIWLFEDPDHLGYAGTEEALGFGKALDAFHDARGTELKLKKRVPPRSTLHSVGRSTPMGRRIG